MARIVRILLLIGLIIAVFISTKAQAASDDIVVLEIEGTINPVVAEYIQNGIEKAEEADARACIIQMDTPGGLDTAMRDIVQAILNADIPVIVYVSPSGARAASAGTYITLAGHVAAMAPSTAIGAATPVSLGSGGEAEISDEMQRKIINDAVAYIIGLAENHGRNAEWAEDAVRKGISASEQEALELGVIEIIASNLDDLVSQLDGREVTMLDGSVVTLHTEGASIIFIKMTLVQDFLHTIADPNIAFILLSLATLGIFIEITNPGLIFPGVVGAICGILAFYSLGQLPVNWAGVLLIVLAFGLFVGEVLTSTFGLFTAGGVVALVLGALILIPGGSPVFEPVNPWLIAVVTICIAGLFAFVINRIIRAHRRQASTGREELVGKKAVAKTVLDPEGIVFFKGERWNATSESGRVEPKEEVIITRVDSLNLWVTKKE
jgi:membrane-bound serine protease (ClpP class)